MYHLPVLRIIFKYITREIFSLFLLGLGIFTLVLLMGRLIALTDLVVSRGVPVTDVAKMIIFLLPSFLVSTIPMAFLLSVLLAFSRLSADNEITVMKASGLSLYQLLPPVFICAFIAMMFSLLISLVGVPWGNTAFKDLSMSIVKQNITSTIHEKTFWDEIPGIVMYTDRYNPQNNVLNGVVIHDGRIAERPLTIFAKSGVLSAKDGSESLQIVLENGSIHSATAEGLYRLVHFGEYAMAIGSSGTSSSVGKSEADMKLSEIFSSLNDKSITEPKRLKLLSELYSRFTFPCASLVFAILAVPLGIQNRRSGKSGGFTYSLAIILTYYVLMSVMKTVAERGIIAPVIALWVPNIIFLAIGMLLMRMATLEQKIPDLRSTGFYKLFRKKP